MRVLFVTVPVRAHTMPLVPLAWALRGAGHEVLFASAGEASAVAGAGLPMADIAPGLNIRPLFVSLFARHDGLNEPRPPSDEENLTIAEIFGKLNLILADGLDGLASAWRPDLIVHDATAVAGAVIGAKLGIPAVRHDYAMESAEGLRDRFGAAMDAELARFGLDALPEEIAAINITPRSVVPSDDWPMRCLPFNGGATTPPWLLTEPRRPLVAVTMGLTWGNLYGPVEQIVSAAAEVDADFVLALGERDVSHLGALPPNVRAEGWVSMSELIPRCAALIHHGGGGTAFAALAHGVPQLIYPGGISHFEGADAIAGRGAALIGAEEDFDPALVGRVLEDPAVRAAATEVSAEMAQMPSPLQVARRLTSLVA
ncbi:UDP:flavonoid glycosyltransferase YjiC, YdhE family [Amycolatopsis xylanica]|uniref:UDP:flavonoid glycosyltransferase YjiC, YdhE family n=1 Tax=Amycolatopsis xylanica TaxID=589385 RepID=A0A1H2VPS6_9PSEU|nr:nucleotide disphospho-sugar-binding domain-containing protein [Amycolatopsis xylanica]SDW70306.1 UDP:flavonoid glycosyltransferase YjiC, YdhE family [Amycolatopsis xylanica]